MNAVDIEQDNPTIGLLLCKSKNDVLDGAISALAYDPKSTQLVGL